MKKNIMIAVLLLILGMIGAGCTNADKTDDTNQAVDTSQTEPAADTNNAAQEDTDADANNTAQEDSDADAQDQGSSSSDPEESKVNQLPLDFELSDGEGSMVNLEELGKGKLTFVNFFTTWCVYCMEEMPEFQEVYTEYSDQIEIIIVDVNHDSGEKSIEEVVAWYEGTGYTFPMVIDEDGSKTKDFLASVQGYPTTFVYNPDGEFLGYIPGALNKDTMVQIITDQLN